MLVSVETKVKVKMNVYEYVYKRGNNAYVNKEVFAPDVPKKEVIESIKGDCIGNGCEFVAITKKIKEVRIYHPLVQVDLDEDVYDVTTKDSENR